MPLFRCITVAALVFCFLSSSFSFADNAISSNPGAVNIETGNGDLGKLLGIKPDSGVRLGGLLIEDYNYLFCGGLKPKKGSENSVFILSLTAETEKFGWWQGGKFGVEFFQLNAHPTNREAGCVQGYNSLTGQSPLDRSQLYQLWLRQEFFDKKLVVRVGKQIPNYDFNNVIKPLELGDKRFEVAATSGLIYTPLFVNSTLLGVLPGYYNSVFGMVITYAPVRELYINYGLYDGNLARGKQTGLRGPQFNSYRFQIAELGYAWGLKNYPGNIGVGIWNQSGKLKAGHHINEHGCEGFYAFGTQRLWWRHPGVDSSGIIGLVQAGINDSKTLPVNGYAGAALTFYGLVPMRNDDSFGFGFALGRLNSRLFERKRELILQGYYQAYLLQSIYFVGALTYIPRPGAEKNLQPAIAGTARIIALF